MQLFFRPFELLARIDEEPCCDGNDAKECGVGECIVPAIVGDEECSDDRSEDAADISPEVHPAGYGAGVLAAEGNNSGPAGAHGEAECA